MVEVTQEDTKIAREVFRSAGHAICEALEHAGCDETAIFTIAQTLATHRTEAVAVMREENERLRRELAQANGQTYDPR